jgi:hypothetical protein
MLGNSKGNTPFVANVICFIHSVVRHNQNKIIHCVPTFRISCLFILHALRRSDPIRQNNEWIMNSKYMEVVVVQLEVLFRRLITATEKNTKKIWSGNLVSGPKLHAGTFSNHISEMQETLRLLQNPKFRYHYNKTSVTVFIRSQIKSLQFIIHPFLKNLLFPHDFFLPDFSTHICTHFLWLLCVLHDQPVTPSFM